MSKSTTRAIQRDVEHTLEDIALALKEAAEGVGGDAEDAVAKAVVAVRLAAERLALEAGPRAKAVSERAAQGVKEHPIASAAAALAAAAALIALLARRKDRTA